MWLKKTELQSDLEAQLSMHCCRVSSRPPKNQSLLPPPNPLSQTPGLEVYVADTLIVVSSTMVRIATLNLENARCVCPAFVALPRIVVVSTLVEVLVASEEVVAVT